MGTIRGSAESTPNRHHLPDERKEAGLKFPSFQVTRRCVSGGSFTRSLERALAKLQ
jgi:hypothetical protein